MNTFYTGTRTDGDGMETNTAVAAAAAASEHTTNIKTQKSKLVDTLIYRPTDNSASYLRPVIPVGRIYHLVPKYSPKKKKCTGSTHYPYPKPKDPKFVPYEPYKAAIEPIISKRKKLKKEQPPVVAAAVVVPKVSSKNNVDIHDLVTQMSELTAAELNKAKKEALQNDEPLITRKQWDTEKCQFETDIKNLRETNTHLENQLKFQAQVNQELKTLLVAAVGEDLESRVQHLTEDKLALARELLNSANHLTSHREHTEWLSGQCEVWRSKFLASSLMVEELARWKSALSNKVSELKDILKRLMEERTRVREQSLNTYNSLSSLMEHHHDGHHKTLVEIVSLKNTNILELSQANKLLAEGIETHLLKDLPEPRRHKLLNSDDSYTIVEKAAFNAIRNPVVLSDRPDVICNAVMGAALQVGRGQLFLQHPADHATCCKHCKGEVQDV